MNLIIYDFECDLMNQLGRDIAICYENVDNSALSRKQKRTLRKVNNANMLVLQFLAETVAARSMAQGRCVETAAETIGRLFIDTHIINSPLNLPNGATDVLKAFGFKIVCNAEEDPEYTEWAERSAEIRRMIHKYMVKTGGYVPLGELCNMIPVETVKKYVRGRRARACE